MTGTKPTDKTGTPAHAGDAPRSMLRRFDQTLKGEGRALLFTAVAERLRSGLLTPDESALISSWFDRLAAGEKPADVLIGERRGRKRGSNGVTFLKGEDVSLPDHVDLAWAIRQWIHQTGDEDRIFALVAKRYGKTEDYIRGLYQNILPTLAPDPNA